MTKIWKIILCFIIICPGFHLVKAAPNDSLDNQLYSPSIVVMDRDTKRVLYDKNGDEKRYPASLTKVMTMLLAIENGNLNEPITISEETALSIEFGSSHISLMPQETITRLDALMATNLASANDAANALAQATSGDLASFVTLMNQKATEIGCENTHFENPNGLHDDNHYTTAKDMAKIMAVACENPIYVKLTSVMTYEIPPTNITAETRYLYSKNRCMNDESEDYVKEIICGKPGYTIDSGHSFVAYASDGTTNFIICLLGANNASEYYADLKLLTHYILDNYHPYQDVNDLWKKPKLSFFGKSATLETPFDAPLVSEAEKAQLHIENTINQAQIKHAKKQDCIGSATLYLNDEVLQTRNLCYTWQAKDHLLSFLAKLIVAFLALILFAIVILVVAKKIYTQYHRYKRKKNRRIRR